MTPQMTRAAAEINALKNRPKYQPLCADCGRPGYFTRVGPIRIVGHLNQRVSHPFHLDMKP